MQAQQKGEVIFSVQILFSLQSFVGTLLNRLRERPGKTGPGSSDLNFWSGPSCVARATTGVESSGAQGNISWIPVTPQAACPEGLCEMA